MKYKDQQNKVHDIDPSYINLLPAGCVQITDEEATALLAPAPLTAQQRRDAIQAQIEALESKEKMNRFVREGFIQISVKEAAALGYTEPQLYAANLGYKKLKDHDAAITTLRLQMEAIL